MASAAGGGYVPNAAYPSMLSNVPSFAPNSSTGGYVGLNNFGPGMPNAVNHDVGQIVSGQSLDNFPVAANLTVVKRSTNDPVYDITQNQLVMLYRNPETTNGPNFVGEALTISGVNFLLFDERHKHKNGLKIWEDWGLNGIASSNSIPKSDERAARLMFMISFVARGRFPVFLFSNEKVIYERDRVHLVLAKYRRESSGLIVKLATDSNAHLTSTEVVPAANIFEGKESGETIPTNAKFKGRLTGPNGGESKIVDNTYESPAPPPASERKYGDGGTATAGSEPASVGAGGADVRGPIAAGGTSSSSSGGGTPIIISAKDEDTGDDKEDPNITPSDRARVGQSVSSKSSAVQYPKESPTADDEFWQFGFEVTRAGTHLNASDYMYTKDNDSKKRWIGYCKPNIGQIGSLGDAGLISLEPNEVAAVNQFMHPGPNRRWMNLAGPDQSSMVKVLLVLN